MMLVLLGWFGFCALGFVVFTVIELIEAWRRRDRQQPVDWIDWIWLWRADDNERWTT